MVYAILLYHLIGGSAVTPPDVLLQTVATQDACVTYIKEESAYLAIDKAYCLEAKTGKLHPYNLETGK